MADFAPTMTPRLKLAYNVGGKPHTMTVRAAGSATISDAPTYVGKLQNFLEAIRPILWSDWTIISATWAELDSDVFIPVAAPTISAGGPFAYDRNPSENAVAIQFLGRGLGGSKGSFYLYGSALTPRFNAGVNDYRVFTTENGTLATAMVSLSEVAPGFYAIDGTLMNWYPYVNVKSNDHWVRKIRAGG